MHVTSRIRTFLRWDCRGFPLPGGKVMRDFDMADLQPMADLESLVQFARDAGVGHLVYSIAKITRPRFGRLPPMMEKGNGSTSISRKESHSFVAASPGGYPPMLPSAW